MNVNDMSHVIPDPAATTVDETRTMFSTNQFNSLIQYLQNMQISIEKKMEDNKEDMKNMQVSLEKKMEIIQDEVKEVQVSLNKTEKKIDEIVIGKEEEVIVEEMVTVKENEVDENENMIEEIVPVEENLEIAKENEIDENKKMVEILETGQVPEMDEQDHIKGLDEINEVEKESKTDFNYNNVNEILEKGKNYNKREQLFDNQIACGVNDEIKNIEMGIYMRQQNITCQKNISNNDSIISHNAPLALSFELLSKFQTSQIFETFHLNSLSCVAIFKYINVIKVRFHELEIIRWEMRKKLYIKVKFIFKKVKVRDKMIYRVSYFKKCSSFKYSTQQRKIRHMTSHNSNYQSSLYKENYQIYKSHDIIKFQ